jgi:predicted NACHT family NTPase
MDSIGITGRLEVEQRLIVAARIAAVTIFANRFAVWTEPNNGDVPVEDVLIGILAVQSETANGNPFPVSEDVIREVLDTGLFSSRGASGRMGWAHQTYAEFLAAWYIQSHNLPLEQVLSLILNGDRVVPQLQETVKWLANVQADVFHAVLKTDPDVLLYSEVATASDKNKEMLIAAILSSHDLENLPYRHEIGKLYKDFKHSTIVDQIKPYLCDTKKNTICRMVAIDIAKECEVTELQEQLAIITLNKQESDSLRLDAALAICEIGDKYTKSKLKPLALLKPKNDSEEELKGCGLRAVWPEFITITELFDTLSQPVSTILGGRYQNFIANNIGEHLQTFDLPVALKWLRKEAEQLEGGDIVYHLHYPFSELSDSILFKSWQHLENPEILKLFTDIALIRLQSWRPIISSDTSNEELNFQEMLKNDEKRYYLIESIVESIPESDFKPYLLTRDEQRIIFEHDFNWSLSKSHQISSPDVQKKWAALVRFTFNWDPEKVKLVLENCKNNTFLYAEFCKLLEPIELSSEEAQNLRNWYLEDTQREEERIVKQNFVVDPSPQEKIINTLHRMDEDINAWCNLCHEMTLKPDGTHHSKPYVRRLTDVPGWEEAVAETRLRILNAAKTYVEKAQIPEEKWLGTSRFPHAILAGYQALSLLYEADQEALQSLSSDIWRKWTAIILDYPQWNTTEASKHIRQALLLESYKYSPSEFRRVFSTLIDAENNQSGSIHINRLVRNCWDVELIKVILEKVQNPELTPTSFGSLLEDLLIYNQPEAKGHLEK